jgi:hypothetical protein
VTYQAKPTKSQRELLVDALPLARTKGGPESWLDVRESSGANRLWHLQDPGRGWTPRNVIALANTGYIALNYTFGSGDCQLRLTDAGVQVAQAAWDREVAQWPGSTGTAEATT